MFSRFRSCPHLLVTMLTQLIVRLPFCSLVGHNNDPVDSPVVSLADKVLWTKVTDKHCVDNVFSSGYSNLAQAQAACLNVGPRCLGVEDLGCDGRNEFYVCTAGTIGRSNVGSCVYTLAGMVICNCNSDKLGLVENCYFILVVERSFVIDCVARAFKLCMIQFLDIA